MAAHRAPTGPLIAEFHELEHANYREAFRRAERPGSGVALRALAAHTNGTLDELRPIAQRRGVSLASPANLWRDAVVGLREALRERLLAPPHPEAPAETARLLVGLRRGIGAVRVLEDAAEAEGDLTLAAWCHRWLQARERFVEELLLQLAPAAAPAPRDGPSPPPPSESGADLGRRGGRRRRRPAGEWRATAALPGDVLRRVS